MNLAHEWVLLGVHSLVVQVLILALEDLQAWAIHLRLFYHALHFVQTLFLQILQVHTFGVISLGNAFKDILLDHLVQDWEVVRNIFFEALR